MDFSTVRLYGSIAIIIGCFIFLYPKLLQPLISTMFGGSGNSKNKDVDDFVPPPLRNRNPQMGDPRQDVPDNIRRNMRHGPHPGMRAAAAEQSKQTKGSGRGMMGVILPMYAVGIVVYLIYTLCKVFNKKNDKHSEERSPERRQPTQGRSVDQFSDDEAEMDMRKLQLRLAETEAQMSKILAAMKSVQGKVDVTADTVLQAEQNTGGGDTQENVADEKQSSPTDKDSSTESTPDSESYEIVNKSNEESNGDEDRTGQPETIKSKTSEEVDKNEEEEVGAEESDEETQHTQETNDDGDDTDEEVEDVLMEDKNDKDEEENRTVRKRIPKTDDTES